MKADLIVMNLWQFLLGIIVFCVCVSTILYWPIKMLLHAFGINVH